MKVSNETIYIAILICIIAFLIIVAPLIVKNEKIRKFTVNKFNLFLLIIIAITLFFLDNRIGVVFTILLLTFLSYAKLEGFNIGMQKENEYAKQFDLYTPQTLERNNTYAVETFDNCDTSNKLPSEQFENTILDSKYIKDKDSTLTNTSNVSEYMNQLQQDSITNKLKTEHHDYDTVGCRYDLAEAGQSTTLNGPPLGWNDTYNNQSINGQLFYPLMSI
jgi:MFS superfamily sulfate permease-like transporter